MNFSNRLKVNNGKFALRRVLSVICAAALLCGTPLLSKAVGSVLPKSYCFSNQAVTLSNATETKDALKTLSDLSPLTDDGIKYFSFGVTTEAAGAFCVGLKENAVDGETELYWLEPEAKVHLISDDGDVTEVEINDEGALKITGKFKGRAVIALNCFTRRHTGWGYDNGTLDLDNLYSVQLWNLKTDTRCFKFGDFRFSDTFDTSKINLVFTLSEAETELSDTSEEHINANYAGVDKSLIGNSKYLIFSAVNKSGSAAEVCIGLKENQGAKLGETENGTEYYAGNELYWPTTAEIDIHYIDYSGNINTLKRSNAHNGAITIPADFSGYIAIALADLSRHSGHNSGQGDGLLDVSDIAYLQLWNFGGTRAKFGGLILASSVDEFVSKDEETDYTLFGDLNEDKATDLRDLVRLKKLIAAEEAPEETDLNFDGETGAADIAVLKKSLLFGDTENDPYGIYYRYSAIADTEALIDGDFTVIVDKKLPQALIYRYTDGRYIVGAGDVSKKVRTYSINGEKYTPEVEFEKTSQNSAKYTVTVRNAELSADVKSDLTFTYEYTVSGGELKKKMTSLTGDDENSPLVIKDINPYLKADSYMISPAVAASNGSGDELLGELSDLSDNTVYDSSFAFVSNSGLAAGIYTSSSYSNPYTASVNGTDYRIAKITSDGYVHRLSDGTRVQKQTDDGRTDVLYESVLGFATDINQSGDIDWQDAALWLRGKIPQMSTELREYLKTGNWGQYVSAFPTGVSKEDFVQDEYGAASYVYSTYAQALEVLREHYNMTDGVGTHSFEMVGWQGRGHDYGWPDLAEQTFNPALTDLSVLQSAKWASFRLKATSGGGMVIGFNESGGALYWWPNGTEHTVYFIDENGLKVNETTSSDQGYIRVPQVFDGYVVFSIEDFACHPASGYQNADTDGKLTLDELASLQIWNCAAGWELFDLMLGSSLEAIAEAVTAGAADGAYRISESGETAVTAANNERAFLNIEYDESLTVNYYKELYAALGGDLSFHINQSDVTENSLLYKNNAASVTEDISYNSYFGWKAYNNSHFVDIKSGAFEKRVDAFIEKYYAPRIIYSDVYTDRTGLDYGINEDRYAKAMEVNYWRSKGTEVATEYYSQEKYLNGQFLFINMRNPSVIDSFMTSGNVRISAFGDGGNPYAEKYLYGTASGHLTAEESNKVSHTYAAAQYNVQAATRYAFNTYWGAFVNGLLGEAGILYRKSTENGTEVIYGGGLKAVYNAETGETAVYENDRLIANDTGVFIKSPDGANKILASFSTAQTVTRALPESLAGNEKLTLYRLTGDGRVFEKELTPENGSVTFAAAAFTSYAITAERDTATEVAENLALSAKIKASSRMPNGLSADKMNLGNRIKTLLKPAGKKWSDLLDNLGTNMLDEKGNLKIEYPAYPQTTTDGDPNTCWVPCGESKPWIEYDFTTSEAVSAVKITESADGGGKITSFKILAAGENGVYSEIYEGGEVPQTEIKFSRAVTASKLKLEITGTEGTPQIAELAIY